MSHKLLRQLAARMSLRTPQERSLEILHQVLETADLNDTASALAAIQALAGRDVHRVADFERDFVSLCFALATGVGKTRLMGAFIAYLALTNRSKHFFVLAPNTTIYEKLIDDFTPGKPKYVFKGISEFAQSPPQLVTGDNWDQGRGLRRQGELYDADVIINVFNVDKINKDVGRIRGPHDVIGEEGYYRYLADLPDLVMLMDEAHRYRAKAGFKAIADLKPMLGLELTATPKTVGARSVDFQNVIYRYGLAEAMEDGFVKEPAVATRKDFDPRSVNDEELERIKLEDGVHAHENVKLKLVDFAERTGKPLVHPFMLVVAQDTRHAEDIRQQLESEHFFSGRYKGRVIRVDSALRGEESDEATERLVALENDGTTEIVIHVNKLKEGWDVKNLYTIVPLRASASDILTEQTLGRGLRLPYGVRTGDEAIDTLTVIAHDRFDELIRRAREPGSILMKSVEIGGDGNIWRDGAIEIKAPTILETMATGQGGFGEVPQSAYLFSSPEGQTAAAVTYQVIRQMERELPNLAQLRTPQVQEKIARRVEELTRPFQGTLEGIVERPDIGRIVDAVTSAVAANTIEIPQIVVLPTSDVTFSFSDFDLADLNEIAPQPLPDEIIVQQMRTGDRLTIARTMAVVREDRLEDYLVVHLIDFEQVDYDTNADLLYKLAGQMVGHLRSYLPDDETVEKVLVHQGKSLAQFIFRQMMRHYAETPTRYRARVSRGYQVLEPLSFRVTDPSAIRDFRAPVIPASETRRSVFSGFSKCAYPRQSFQSDEERRFAVILDSPHEPSVIRWVKPGPRQFQIEFRRTERYEPDFVVETNTEKLLVEIKARRDLEDETVKAKSRAAREWIGHATHHAASWGGKPWRYLLVPHDAVLENVSVAGLVARFSLPAILPDVSEEAIS
ncbi:MAG: DEAD/DEAH box helicase family protein [Burkholderiales bacterium]|nr:DEAD/DEAH box helicase family protein [Burkholderiales bacterium]